jgi:amino acid transporter
MPINPIDAMQEFAVSLPVVAITLVGIAVFLSRIKALIWKPKGPRRRARFRILAANAALGMSFLPFAAIYRPRMIEVVKAQIQQQEDVDEDDNGGPESPLKHLLRQLRRIRRGEMVETLTVRRE